MRWVALIAVLALLGGVAATIVFLIGGSSSAAAVALVLGGLALAAGVSAVIGPLGAWGAPGDESWPALAGGRRGGH